VSLDSYLEDLAAYQLQRHSKPIAPRQRAGCKTIFKDAGLSARLAFVGDTQAAPHPTRVVVASALDENAVIGGT
jgi:hypothetical protein